MFNVLIADDELIIREGIASGINWTRLGFNEPFIAENGQEVIQLIKTVKIDIAILDIKMPGISGLELAKFIFEEYNYIKVIIHTGYGEFEYAQKALKWGVIDFILKPTKLNELEGTLVNIKKSLLEEERKIHLIEKSDKIIRNNKLQEKQKFIGNILFNRIDNIQEFKDITEKFKFTPLLQRIAVLEIIDYPEPFHERNSDIFYVNYIDELLIKALDKRDIEYISFFEKDRFVVYFFCEISGIAKNVFNDNTSGAIEEIKASLSNIEPFCLNIGLSYIDKNILNIRAIYYDALKNLDEVNQKKTQVVGSNNSVEINIIEILSSKFQMSVNTRDIPSIYEEVDAFFKALSHRTLTQIKSAAIELLNYSLWLITGNIVTNIILKEKIYTSIINCVDVKDIQQILNDTLRVMLFNTDKEDEDSNEIAEKVIAYLRKNFYKDLKLNDVAGKFFISPGYLGRIMKRYFNKTFLEVLTEIRIKNAVIMLKNSRVKVYEVGQLVGFKDSKYFSQIFKKYTGKLPSEFL